MLPGNTAPGLSGFASAFFSCENPPAALGYRRDRVHGALGRADVSLLPIRENESLVFDNRPARRNSVLIALVLRSGRCGAGEIILGVHRAVAQELVSRAVKFVGSRLDRRVGSLFPCSAPVLRGIRIRLYFEFPDGVNRGRNHRPVRLPHHPLGCRQFHSCCCPRRPADSCWQPSAARRQLKPEYRAPAAASAVPSESSPSET